MFKKYQTGQTLIEVVVALSAAVVVVSAITVAVISSLNNAEFSKNQNIATQYAQQATEILRSQRNSDFGTFKQLQGNYCLAKACTALSNNLTDTDCGPKQGQTCGQNIDIYSREIIVEQPNQGAVGCNKYGYLITINVSWADNKCTSSQNPFCHTVSLVSCLSDAGVISSP